MANLFASAAMAEGYARSRPAVHAWVLRQLPGRYRRALDLGCGSGISTAALAGLAEHRVGLEPAESMLAWAPLVSPGADFLVGQAEALPFADESFDLIAAAGSLNYCDLPPALREINRVLTPHGRLAIYDFAQGKEFEDSPDLTTWNTAFKSRYPSPEGPGRFDPGGEPFSMILPYNAATYLDYALTETNVSAAIARGIPADEIRAWCQFSLDPVFAGQTKSVIFRGYLAVKSRNAAWSPPAF